MKEKQRGDAGSSSSRGRGQRRSKPRRKASTGEPKEEGGKAVAKDKCLNCGKFGHWTRNCCAPDAASRPIWPKKRRKSRRCSLRVPAAQRKKKRSLLC